MKGVLSSTGVSVCDTLERVSYGNDDMSSGHWFHGFTWATSKEDLEDLISSRY